MKLTCFKCANCNSVSEPSEDDTLPVYWRNVKITSKTKGMCGLSDEVTEIDLCSIQCFYSYMEHLFDL